MRISLKFLAVLTGIALFSLSALAQTQFGAISGVVTDPHGAVVTGAPITVTNSATGVVQNSETNNQGIFTVANVRAGEYQVAATAKGFRKTVTRVTVGVAQTVNLSLTLEVGAAAEAIEVTATMAEVNTINAAMGAEVTATQVADLPLLTRNPYALAAFAPGASDTGQVTGDTRGLGLAVAGGRTSDVNFMLDGGENNDTFTGSVGQTIPLDAVEEFRVQTNNNTAEFGRNAVVTNVIMKSGTNAFHGTAYEYYRGASLATATFNDKANDIPKSNFVRNQFGGAIGGPIFKNKTFFYGSLEGLRVRSTANQQFYLATTDWMSAAAPAAQNFVNTFGGVQASDCNAGAITADTIWETMEGNTGYGLGNGLVDQSGTLIPANTNLFCLAKYKVPADAGAGSPQNTWNWTGKVDHNFSDKTALHALYAYYKSDWFPGTVSFSPYPGFNTGQAFLNQNLNITLTHTFSPFLFNETRAVYERFHNEQPLGAAPSTTPCWQYGNFTSPPASTSQPIAFPGYVATDCSFSGIPFGGPQNVYQFAQNWTLVKGKHSFKWGGSYLHLRDNRTFGAYENGWNQSFTMQDMLNGWVDESFIAIDPRGHVPGDSYDTAVDGPIVAPDFTRHFHYNELAFYGQDTWKITNRFTLTAGARWEYFGVLHSPWGERELDSNLIPDAVGPKTTNPFEAVAQARFERTTHLYRSDLGDISPRVGIAYDMFGNGKAVLRSGYGIYYNRNFGNSVFNVIQNPPNYMTVALDASTPGQYIIDPNQFNTLAPGGVVPVLTSSARALGPNLLTAYTEQWNATLESNALGKGILASLSYVGSNGKRLYSLADLNFRGSCLLAPAGYSLPEGCVTGTSTSERLNQTGLTGANNRGNLGKSHYYGMDASLRGNIPRSGVSLSASYTWSRSFDNESSFFADSSFEGLYGFGFRNPYLAGLDMAPSANDIRHRFSTSVVWQIPWTKNYKGITGLVVDGWNLSGTVEAQTGGLFSVYEPFADPSSGCGRSHTNFCYPVQVGPIPKLTATPDPSVGPNSFDLYVLGNDTTFQQMGQWCINNGDTVGGVTYTSDRECTEAIQAFFPTMMERPHQFRTPGFYTTTFGILKDFKLPKESMKLQVRGEFFNLLNHSNMYAQPGTNQYTSGASSVVIGSKGLPPGFPGVAEDRRNIQLAVKLIF